jgi:hypothetical protein
VANFAVPKAGSRALARDRTPIMCAVPNCPHFGTMSESTHHDNAENVKWYCHAHWEVRGPGQHLERMGVTREIEQGLHPRAANWRDRECEYRMRDLKPEDVAAARQFLRSLVGARHPDEVRVEREHERSKSLMRSERESG